MEALKEFIIPIEGLSIGVHQFDFQIDKEFFDHFENAPVEDGNFMMQLHFDKRPDMLVLTFEFTGTFLADCDRCLEAINIPVQGNQQLLVKYSDKATEDAEIVYITKDTPLLNVAKYAYESICLNLPITKVCDAIDNPPCNENMLDYLNRTDEEDEKAGNPIWEALKNFKKDN